MANIKDLKKKIKSTKNTYKITKAMKLVSAAKLAKSQGKITGLRPYANELTKTIKQVTSVVRDYEHELMNSHQHDQAAILVMSSDKGLCGSFNSNLIKKVRSFIHQNSQLDFKLFFIGKKAKEVLTKEFENFEHLQFKKGTPSVDELRSLADRLAGLFRQKEISKLYLANNNFISLINVKPSVKQLLPFKLDLAQENDQELKSAAGKGSLNKSANKSANTKTAGSLSEQEQIDYVYDPSAKQILDALIPEVYFTTINTALLESVTGEHASRMIAMENASKNCSEVIKSVTLKMNKLRQAAITTELIEVVSGAESLKG